MALGPDEPFDDRSQENMKRDHRASLQQVAQRQGVVMDAAELERSCTTSYWLAAGMLPLPGVRCAARPVAEVGRHVG